MRAYPVVNVLGQSGQGMISTKDFNSFVNFSIDQANTLAAIARAHDLSAEEEQAVRRGVESIRQYTVPMTSCPGPVASTPTCPIFPESSAISSGIPWWAAALAGIGLGAAAVGLLA